MTRGVFRSSVVLAVLIAVITTLIAPTVDLPETVLREHHVVSHMNGGHAQGKVQTSSTTGPSHLGTDVVGTNRPTGLRSGEYTHVEAFRVLRC
jgi:hypothetical protein